MTTLEMQIAEFASLGEVFDPCGGEAAVARELAEMLMAQPLTGGPIARITGLTRVLRILKLTVRMVTAERDLAAYSATAIWPYRKLSKLLSAHTSTMQSWVTAGRKVAEPQQVPRGTEPVNSTENSNSNSEFAGIQ